MIAPLVKVVIIFYREGAASVCDGRWYFFLVPPSNYLHEKNLVPTVSQGKTLVPALVTECTAPLLGNLVTTSWTSKNSATPYESIKNLSPFDYQKMFSPP